MDETLGRRVCELIVGIIATDDELHPAEFEFMLKAFETFGISKSEDDEVLAPTVRSFEAAKAMKALPDEVRSQAMDLLVESAVVDGKVVEAERTYLHAVARAMDMSIETVDAKVGKALAQVTAQ
jgi:uncharacterized tellurite resistance protein B-like protein